MLFACRQLWSLALKFPTKITSVARYSAIKNPKRFYKEVHITSTNEDCYEVCLDKRKLKTPGGKVLVLPNESIAQLVAHEWRMQGDHIQRSSMHMTSLCNTVLDNPAMKDDSRIVAGIMEFVDSDTLCCRSSDEDEDLYQWQKRLWDPVLQQITLRYPLIKPRLGEGISLPEPMSDEQRKFVKDHLMKMNRWALVGFQTCADTLKSLYLTWALCDHLLTVQEAVYLSRLEVEFQIAKWGAVPWYHDVETHDMRTRVAASTLLMYLAHERRQLKFKLNADSVKQFT